MSVVTLDRLAGVQWERMECIVAPMTAEGWHAWLESNVGSLDAGDLGTTES
jgi:hypothetical protein